MIARRWTMGQDVTLPTPMSPWWGLLRGTYGSVMGQDRVSGDVMGGDPR